MPDLKSSLPGQVARNRKRTTLGLMTAVLIGLTWKWATSVSRAPEPDHAQNQLEPPAATATVQHDSESQPSEPLTSEAPTPKPSTQYSPQEFQAVLHDVQESLATREQLRSLSEDEVHGVPAPILKSGVALGKIAEILQQQPELAQPASEFYWSCARNPELAQSIRALCLSRHRSILRSRGEDRDTDTNSAEKTDAEAHSRDPEISEEVSRLSRALER
ncbi:MAG: hypothetical protein RJB38_180 [Pseudomonadota bacterium]|jgi:hypothetical protein